MAANVSGASAVVDYKTFDVIAPNLEKWLNCKPGDYMDRMVIGVSVVEDNK